MARALRAWAVNRWKKSRLIRGIYWPGVSLRWLIIGVFIDPDPAFLLQGCALRKIEGSPALWTCEIQCAQQMISVKKQRFSSWPRTKVTDVGAKGHRAWSWSIKMQKWMRPIFSHLERTSLVNKWIITWSRRDLLLAGPTREIPSGLKELVSRELDLNCYFHSNFTVSKSLSGIVLTCWAQPFCVARRILKILF